MLLITLRDCTTEEVDNNFAMSLKYNVSVRLCKAYRYRALGLVALRRVQRSGFGQDSLSSPCHYKAVNACSAVETETYGFSSDENWITLPASRQDSNMRLIFIRGTI